MTRGSDRESQLDQVLSQPIVRLLMAADGLEVAEVRSQLRAAADRLRRRQPTAPLNAVQPIRSASDAEKGGE